MAFGLGPWARGNGLMTRALRLALAWAFAELDLKVVHWRATVGNWPARAVAARCGFKVEGTVRGLIAQRGKRYDGWIGSLRRGDFLTGGPHRVRAGTVSTAKSPKTTLQRYSSAMATIQIREIPEDAYEVIRKRARAAGRSIQSYMRDWVVDFAGRPTTEEALAVMDAVREGSDTPGATRESILADLADDRR